MVYFDIYSWNTKLADEAEIFSEELAYQPLQRLLLFGEREVQHRSKMVTLACPPPSHIV